MKLWRRIRARERSRGVAVLEFTLSIVFLVPLMMAALDFGYYFYVAATAEEAARQGVQQAIRLGPCTVPINCGAAGATLTAPASGSGAACVGGDAACYMNGPPLSMGTAVYTNVSCSCTPAPPYDTYSIVVQVDFAPAVGVFRALMPAAGMAPNKVRYIARLTGTN